MFRTSLRELRMIIRDVLTEVDTDPANNPGRPDDPFDYLGMRPKATWAMAHPSLDAGDGGDGGGMDGGGGDMGAVGARMLPTAADAGTAGDKGDVNKSGTFTCSICGQPFSSGNALGGHMKVHEKVVASMSKPADDE